ncbi:MAG: hypothetical protein R3C56_38745 [Pirellulaceae bacterium]
MSTVASPKPEAAKASGGRPKFKVSHSIYSPMARGAGGSSSPVDLGRKELLLAEEEMPGLMKASTRAIRSQAAIGRC